MDYKELIRQFRAEAKAIWDDKTSGWAVGFEKAATALETLLAERDALMAEVKGHCSFCANRKRCLFDEDARISCAYFDMKNWQWRGPADRKEAQHERVD